MKKLSDYNGEEAIDLWADLMEPTATILADPEVAKFMQSGKPPIKIAHKILKTHKKEAIEILTRIDDTPVNGLSVVTRLLSLLAEISSDETIKSFFGTQGQKTEDMPSGSPTENIEEKETSDAS